MKGLTINTVTKACGGILYGDNADPEEFSMVTLDSRQIEDGGLFIAAKGERVDGHSYISQAFEKGCRAVICEKLPDPLPGPCILAKDSFKALQKVAAYYRSLLTVQVIGITGSVGKTSTKEVIASVLSQRYRVLKTEGNFNNEIGLPLTILRIREEHEAAVLEMGINHFGEMHRLSEIARPDICVITNIGECHLEYLNDRDGVLKAKSEIFDFMKEDGNVCLNGDDDKLIQIKSIHGKNPVFFGLKQTNDVTANQICRQGLFGTKAEVRVGGTLLQTSENTASPQDRECLLKEIRITIPGEHMIYNALAATAVGRLLSLSMEEIAKGIEQTVPIDGRSHIIQGKNGITLLDDCYNANPVSMRAALDLLSSADTQKTAVLGDMFELGSEEKKLHAQIGRYAVEKEIDTIICIGTLSRFMYEAAVEEQTARNDESGKVFYFSDIEQMLKKKEELFQSGDTVLIKASHAMGFEQIIHQLQ